MTSGMRVTRVTIEVPESGAVSGLWQTGDASTAVLALAHGAGAGMEHPFMHEAAMALASAGIATLRYQFPFMEQGRRRPDSPSVAIRTVRAAVTVAVERAGALPVFAGGKSFGGRMTSSAAAAEPLTGVRGLVFFGFPLHRPGSPGTERAMHLAAVTVPMLFLQGTRDALANLGLMRKVVGGLATRARMHVVEGGDHGFAVPKRMGMDQAAVAQEMARAVAEWTRTGVG